VENEVILLVQYRKDLISTVLDDCFYDRGEIFRGMLLGKNTIRKRFQEFSSCML